MVHELAARPTAEAQQHSLFRNMPRKERHKAITTMLQPLLRQYGDYQSCKLPYSYLSKATGVPAQQLARGQLGRPPVHRKPKPNLDKEVLMAMPEFQQEYLDAHAHLGLTQRATLMNRALPDAPLWNPYYLRTAYSRLAIKHKMVRINRCKRRPD